MNLKTLPGRVRMEEAALLLGFSTHEIPILVSNGLIKPLGHPPVTGVKYFSIVALEELRRDEKWLAKASDCIVQYWQDVNQRRRPSQSEDQIQESRGALKRRLRLSELRSSRLENAVE
ncbi:MAG: hypothetical protein ACREDS_00585 [Limisphaerales bacterium]